MPLKNATVLIVCDDPETAIKLVQVPTEASVDVVFAANIQEASLKLRQFSFDRRLRLGSRGQRNGDMHPGQIGPVVHCGRQSG